MRSHLRTAAACGIVAPIGFVTTILLAGALREGYAPTRQAISELFEVDAPTATIAVAGFLVFGLLALPFAWALYHALPGDPALPVLAVILDAVGTLAILAFPCSVGCPGPSAGTADLMHSVVAGLAYVGHLAAPLLVARHLRRHPRWAGLRAASWAIGLTALVVFVYWLSGLAGPYGGLAQRVFTIVSDAWFVVAGTSLLRRLASYPRA